MALSPPLMIPIDPRARGPAREAARPSTTRTPHGRVARDACGRDCVSIVVVGTIRGALRPAPESGAPGDGATGRKTTGSRKGPRGLWVMRTGAIRGTGCAG